MGKYFNTLEEYKNFNFDSPDFIAYGDDDDLFEVSISQPAVKRYISFITDYASKHNNVTDKDFMKAINNFKKKQHGYIGGTVYTSPSGEKKLLLPYKLKGAKDPWSKNVIAHETFHAKVPVLGNSEILAHIYGGMNSGDTVFGTYGPVQMLWHAFRSRPVRSIGELAIAGGAVEGGRYIYKKLR